MNVSAKVGHIGIVTVTFNSRLLLDDFISSLESQTHPAWHAFVIDNDSRDGTVAEIEARHVDPERYSIIANKRNVGVAAGNNQGILSSLHRGCNWILLINNDTVFPPRLLEHLLDSATSRGLKAIVPKIHFSEPSSTIWYAGGGFDARKGYTGYHSGVGQRDRGQFDREGTVDYSPTCCMLIHRSVFEVVGLMDESYFAYFDDTDFCWRLKLAGIAIGYTANEVLIHKVGGSTGGTASPFYARMTARNRLYFLRKHFGATAPWRWLILFFPYYVARYLIGSWNPAAFRASIAGTAEFPAMREHIPPLSSSGNPVKAIAIAK